MKYLVKKPIPLISGLLNKNDIIDGNDPKYKNLSFDNSDFFEVYSDPIYQIDQEVIYNERLCKVKNIISSKRYDIIEEGTGTRYTITDKTKVSIPKRFWFINSNGIVCTDCEERSGIKKEGLNYKKITKNYYLTEDLAKEARRKIGNTILK